MAESQTVLEQQLDEMYKKVRSESEQLATWVLWRRIIAYALKVVAAGGGLFVATGLVPEVHQGIGIAVLVAVFVDTISANHDRLLTDAESQFAYKALGDSVKYKYNRDASEYIEITKTSDDATAVKAAKHEITRFMKRANDELVDGLKRIAEFRHKKNIVALRQLSLDMERQAGKGTA